MVGIDSDGRLGEAMLLEMSGGDLPDTLEFSTGSPDSRRLLYAIPEGVTLRPTHQAGGEKHQGVSILGEGAQTAMPPSRHPSGRVYAWRPGHGPGEIALAPAPKWLIDFMSVKGGRAGKPRVLDEGKSLIEGERNNTLASLAGSMRRRGFDRDSILAALRVTNDKRCDPPLDDSEVEKIADSISRYEPAAHSGTNGKGPGGAHAAPGAGGDTEIHLTDVGNAQRMVALHGEDLRYCHPLKKWLVWDGKRWQPDATAEATRRAKATIAELFGWAAGQINEIQKQLEEATDEC
jgi:putative DNA primase/helicase